MENFTPVQIQEFAMVNPDSVMKVLFDSENNSSNLTKIENKKNRLNSFLRIRSLENYSTKDKEGTFYKKNDYELVTKAPLNSQTNKNSKGNLKEIKKKVFEFSKIFNEDIDQESMYENCISPMINDFFKGENVLLFAYGTSCSGKTYTMRGNQNNPGLIPRCINAIFNEIKNNVIGLPLAKRSKFNEYVFLKTEDFQKELGIKTFIKNYVDERLQRNSLVYCLNNISNDYSNKNQDLHYICWISFVEVYNENLIDLLAIDIQEEKLHSLKIARDSKNNFFVSNLRHVFVESAEEAQKILTFGIDNLKKHVSSTAINKNSSRSHSVFTLTLMTLKKNENSDYNVIHVNNLSLCDLAGLERDKKTNNFGLRLREAGKINKSLFSLNRCITVLRQNQKNNLSNLVPYTDSNLTKIFQPFLNGAGLTSMIITINPNPEFFDETLVALEFSATASQLIICKDESRLLLRDKLRRVTQMWLESTRRWSDFEEEKVKNELSNIESLLKTKLYKKNAEEVEENEKMGNTLTDNKEIVQNLIKATDELEASIYEYEFYHPDYVEDLLNKINSLEEKLEQAEEEKDNIDLNVRQEIGNELDKIIKQLIDEHRIERDTIRNRMDNMMQERINILSEQHDYEISKYKIKIENLETNLFKKEEEVYDLNNKIDLILNEKIDLTNQLEEITETYIKNDIQYLLEDLLTKTELSLTINSLNKDLNNIKTIFDSNLNEYNQEAKDDLNKLMNSILEDKSLISNISDLTLNNSFSDNKLNNNDSYYSSKYDSNVQDLLQVTKVKDELNEENCNLKREVRELKVLLDIKDEEIRKLKVKFHKESFTSILEDPCSNIKIENLNNCFADMLSNFKTHDSSLIINCKKESIRKERKKRVLPEEKMFSIADQNYLEFTKEEPKTEKKNKKKKVEQDIKNETKTEDLSEECLDDLAFFVEDVKTSIKKRKGRPKNESVTSTRKRMPLKESHKDSFVLENNDTINFSAKKEKVEPRITRGLRARRNILKEK